MSFRYRVLDRTFASKGNHNQALFLCKQAFCSTNGWKLISINLIRAERWPVLPDKPLRFVYPLIADDFSCEREQSSNLFETMPSDAENGCNQFNSDELKTLCLLHWSKLKVVGRQDNGSYLLKKCSSSSDALGVLMPIKYHRF